MAQPRHKKNLNTGFGARAVKRQQHLLDLLATVEIGKANRFQDKYGQRGKARRYGAEMAEIAKLDPEARRGVLSKSWIRQKKLFIDENDPNTLVRQKRRLNGLTLKFQRELPLSEAEKLAGKKPRAFIAKIEKTRGSKFIQSEYNEVGQLQKKLKLRSGGRFKEQWERDTNGKLIRTHFSTDRVRDGIFFSPVSEDMTRLDQNGKRELVRTKGSRTQVFERDEKTGTLTLKARQGRFSSEYANLRTDGSLASTGRKWGKVWQKEVEYLGDNSKRVTRRILGKPSIRTKLLTDNERARQQKLRDAKPKHEVAVPAGHNQPVAGVSNTADPALAVLMKSAELAKAEQAQTVQAASISPVADASGSSSRFAAAAAAAAVPGSAVPVHRLKHNPVAGVSNTDDPALAALMKSAELSKAEQAQTVQAASISPVADTSGSSSRFAAAAVGTASPTPVSTSKSPARAYDHENRDRNASGSISIRE